VVKDGQLFFAQGYGYADLERWIPATADTTIFRAGSVSKVFTWTAVMQLVEQGQLDLNADVNIYLTNFQISATLRHASRQNKAFPQPITLAHLMTHTAGFEDQIVDATIYAPPEGYRPLPQFLADKMPARIFPPGQIVAYSNYGAALVGQIVAEVSGEPFEQYMARRILEPLEMNHSTFLQPLPPELVQAAAVGYALNDAGLPQAGSFEFILVRPAGSLSTTATDMAHFMIAQLQDGRYDNQRILQVASTQDMRRQHYAFDPRLPGLTAGFAEAYRNDLHLLFHLNTQRAETNWGKLAAFMVARISVTANSDGTLTVNAFKDHVGAPKRWVEIAPLLFQEVGGQSLVAFRADGQGQITAMFNGDQPIFAFQKIAWHEDPLTPSDRPGVGRADLPGDGCSLVAGSVAVGEA
jgi:CubicO group peptidase (beta-lactamase class C family)